MSVDAGRRIKAAAVGQRESARDYLAGMSPEDSKRIEAEALHASGRFRSVDSSTMHERLRDTAMGMRSTDKALELTDTIGEMTTVLQSLKSKDKAIEDGPHSSALGQQQRPRIDGPLVTRRASAGRHRFRRRRLVDVDRDR